MLYQFIVSWDICVPDQFVCNDLDAVIAKLNVFQTG